MISRKPNNIEVIIMKTRKYRTLDQFVESYLRDNPDRVDHFLQIVLKEYEEDGDEKSLLMALRQIAKAKGGMTALSKGTKLSRESLYKSLSPNGNPTLKTMKEVLGYFGYVLTFKAASNHKKEKRLVVE